MSVEKLQRYREQMRTELDKVVEFWQKYSHDTQYGGFFTCIGKDGKIYDELKYVWLQGRQVWMYCRLYRTMERFNKPEILEAAKSGGAFLRRFARIPNSGSPWKCAFCLTRDGKALKVQRTIFSECFYVMAMDELARVTGDKDMQAEAAQMMDQLVHWVRVDPSGLGKPQLSGDTPVCSMAVPMMLLCLVQQLTEARSGEEVDKYREVGGWCVKQILQHLQRGGTAILESVSSEGKELPGCAGRLQNPGDTLCTPLKEISLDQGCSIPVLEGQNTSGFCFYLGQCVLFSQLEWSMKLWWPHCEALIAYLMAYSHTKEPALLERFSQVYDYTFSHFSDAENGEWFGYLTQQGKVTLDFKGGPFKGFFHVPRCLYMCEKILDSILNKQES
uniref:N-acylglucosamine 2-epimerase n=1 Tax=Salmo trutta TaxID=8032 RepID=A0A674DYJ3_SALTR